MARGGLKEEDYETYVKFRLHEENELIYEVLQFVLFQVRLIGFAGPYMSGELYAPDFNVLPIASELYGLDRQETMRLAEGWRIWTAVRNQLTIKRSEQSGKGSSET